MSTEHLLCASTVPDTGTTSLSYPKDAHGSVWSPAGHPGPPDPSPPQPAAFRLPKPAYYQSLRELQGTATKHPGRERDSPLSQSGAVPALCSHPHSQAAAPENRVWVRSHTTPPLRVTQAPGALEAVWLPQLAGPPEGGARVVARPSISLGEAKDRA